MATGIYIGADGVRKVKKIYFGVNGVPRKVKKAYLGVNGVPRLVYSEGISKPPTTALNRARTGHAAAAAGNYAFFAGGGNSNGKEISVDVISSSLGRTVLPFPDYYSTQQYVMGMKAAAIGDYAIFGGGYQQTAPLSASSLACAFSSQLATIFATGFSADIVDHAAASNPAYAIFAFGYGSRGTNYDISAYSAALVRQLVNGSTDKTLANGGKVGDYALFGPGSYAYASNNAYTMTAYGTNLVEQIIREQVVSNTEYATARAGENLIFWGGWSQANDVYAYTPNLVRIPMADTPAAVPNAAGTSLGDSAIFAGGGKYQYGTIDALYNQAYTYDKNLVLAQIQDLASARKYLTAASVGNYAFFAGGQNYSSGINFTKALDTVDIYEN